MIIPSDGVTVPLERTLAAIDERTLLVPMSHVLFRSAFIQDAAAIIKHAHSVGAKVILDSFQAAGTIPIDVKALDTDFCVGGVLKWLCGGPGVAYLYVRPDLRASLEPRLTGWMAHRRPFQFEPTMDMEESSFRLLNGTPQIPALYAAIPGLKIIGEIGIEKIRAKSRRLTALLMQAAARAWIPDDRAAKSGSTCRDGRDQRPGWIQRLPGINPPQVSRRLQAERRRARVRAFLQHGRRSTVGRRRNRAHHEARGLVAT